VRVNDVEGPGAQLMGNRQGKRDLVPGPSVADLVQDLDGMPLPFEFGREVRDDPLDGAVPRRRDGLDPPTDKDDPHAASTPYQIKSLTP
jgi:hypothetical protein